MLKLRWDRELPITEKREERTEKGWRVLLTGSCVITVTDKQGGHTMRVSVQVFPPPWWKSRASVACRNPPCGATGGPLGCCCGGHSRSMGDRLTATRADPWRLRVTPGHIPLMERAFFDSETALLRQMTAEQKLRALDAIRRSAQVATEIGVRLRHSVTVRSGLGAGPDDPAPHGPA
jgi:hypothetical protein